MFLIVSHGPQRETHCACPLFRGLSQGFISPPFARALHSREMPLLIVASSRNPTHFLRPNLNTTSLRKVVLVILRSSLSLIFPSAACCFFLSQGMYMSLVFTVFLLAGNCCVFVATTKWYPEGKCRNFLLSMGLPQKGEDRRRMFQTQVMSI